MRHSIDTYIQGIINDNKSYILDGGYTSVADYLISEAENGLGWIEFFDDEELDGGEPSEEQIDNLRGFLSRNYDYLPIDDEHNTSSRMTTATLTTLAQHSNLNHIRLPRSSDGTPQR